MQLNALINILHEIFTQDRQWLESDFLWLKSRVSFLLPKADFLEFLYPIPVYASKTILSNPYILKSFNITDEPFLHE